MFEQFQRIANAYFLVLLILQVKFMFLLYYIPIFFTEFPKWSHNCFQVSKWANKFFFKCQNDITRSVNYKMSETDNEIDVKLA